MYIKRQIDNDLLKWSKEKGRKSLLLRGARQVGKSSSVRKLKNIFTICRTLAHCTTIFAERKILVKLV